jgi:K+-transporting ATPase KdpF subunit
MSVTIWLAAACALGLGLYLLVALLAPERLS